MRRHRFVVFYSHLPHSCGLQSGDARARRHQLQDAGQPSAAVLQSGQAQPAGPTPLPVTQVRTTIHVTQEAKLVC